MSSLTVYKASAGSGKTFTLASQYIRLLVENPQQYRSILAVTFTNKATEEMKMRILSQLYGIWKKLSDSADYTQHICQQLGYSPQVVSERAGKALHNLLHHYSYFRVSTIDTFFQSVLRNLARELELTANLRVELNDKQVEEQAVDELIQDLKNTDLLLQWILKYVMENIDEDRSWNVMGSIKNFGTTIFRDYYKEHSDALSKKMEEQGFFELYTQRLRQQMNDAQQRMKAIGERFTLQLQEAGFDISDIKNGRNIGSFFEKLKNGIFDDSIVTKTVTSYHDDAANWCKKGTESTVGPLVSEHLLPLLNEALIERPRQYSLQQSAALTLRHLNQLRLLGAIEQKVRTLNSEANRFLLSDTQQLLYRLIDHSDSPFIFEKIGAQLEHIMIDEFQDTSTVQWQNFKVLLEECMSHEGTQNLIVGDVKQSIYRWRSGDWRLLNNIEQHFPLPQRQLEVKSLDTNYRSQRNIIQFNNAFFRVATQYEHEQLQQKVGDNMARQVLKAYDDVEQLIPSGRDYTGKVCITLLPAEDYRQQVIQQTCDTVSMLLQQGAKPADIAILIRAKDVVPDIIDSFARQLPGIDIVSDEAFRLDASKAVRTLVNALRLLVRPDDCIVKASLSKDYQIEELLDNAVELLRMPLLDLCERLHALFHLERLKDENAYLCAFLDYMSSYVADNAADIYSFLNYWEETLCKKTIQSDAVNGIRLLTIHKSKGLEFSHVIMPFADWKMERTQGNIIWCHTEQQPYAEMPLIPVDYSSKLTGTVFEQQYFDEFLQNRVDNLNLLYVAFTRARNNLFVIGRRHAAATRSQLIEQVLPQVQQVLDADNTVGQPVLMGTDDELQPLVFEYGVLCMKVKEQHATQNVFMQPKQPCDVEIRAYANKTSFRQSNKSRDFIEGENDNVSNNYIKTGCVLHDVLSHIRTSDDIDAALQQMQMDGVLYDTNLTYERISNMLRKRLESPRAKDWFSGRWKIFNECTILSVNQEDNAVQERRPDRVMYDGKEMVVVDFKFGTPKREHQEQVCQYMELLRRMGFDEVKGYLWYVYSNKIMEVI